jgi:hypothetical protein
VNGKRSSIRKHAWIAIIGGLLLSAALWWLTYWVEQTSTPYTALRWFLYGSQIVGSYACIMTRGIHEATAADFAEIAVPINSTIYAGVIFCVLRILASRKTSN